MDYGPLDVRPVTPGRGVVQGECQPLGRGNQRSDRLQEQAGGDAIGPLAGGGDGGVAGLEPVAELCRPDPTGHGPPAPGQYGPEEQECEPRGGPAVEGRGESREPLAWDLCRVRGCHRGPALLGCLAGVVTAIVPAGAGPRRPIVRQVRGRRRGWRPPARNAARRSPSAGRASTTSTLCSCWSTKCSPTRK